MRMRRLITALIGAICILATVFAVGALAADGGCVVSLSTEDKLEQGSGGYASVSIAPSAPLATITVSVHYDESLLTVTDHYNAIGAELAQAYGVAYLYSDFKKRNGYKRSTELSRIHGLYRQDYCGCVFSKREREAQKNSVDKNA